MVCTGPFWLMICLLIKNFPSDNTVCVVGYHNIWQFDLWSKEQNMFHIYCSWLGFASAKLPCYHGNGVIFLVMNMMSCHTDLSTLLGHTCYNALILSSECMCCKVPGVNASVGGSLLQAQPALSPQDGDLRANTGGLLPHFGLAHVEAYRLWEAPVSRRPCMALLWDLWPSHWPHSRGEAGVGRVSFPVLFQKRAGPTKEQGKDNDRGGAQFS